MSKIRANKEGSIRKRDDGRYEVRVTIGYDFATGQSKRISKYANTEEEAVRILHELSYTHDTNPNIFHSMTLEAWLTLCLETYIKRNIKQSTYSSYESYIRVHLVPALGKIRLQELTPRLLQDYYNYKADVEKLSPKTIRNINLFLHRALDFAASEGYISSNPASAVNLPSGERPKIEILTRDEQMQLVRASYQHRYGIFVRLVLFTGLRMGELLGLRWEDVDFQGRFLHIQRTLNRLRKTVQPTNPNEPTTEIVIQTPKSQNSIRTIPLLPQVLQDLQNWKAIQQTDSVAAGGNYIETGMIVTNPFGGHIEPRTFKDYYNQILAMAGLRHFTFHALRHTFATRALEQGMDVKTVSIILGHASVSFTMDTYTHVLNDHKQESMALMEDLFNATQTASPDQVYPVIVTPVPDGTVDLTMPDFPQITCVSMDLVQSLTDIQEQLHEALLINICPPLPTPISMIPTTPGQMVLQIAPKA